MSTLQADFSGLQGQVDSLTQDLGERSEKALLRARRGQRITDVLVDDAASALTLLLATLRPRGGREALEQTMLEHVFDQVGWLYSASLFERSKPTLSGHLGPLLHLLPRWAGATSCTKPAWLDMWTFSAIQSPCGVVLPAIQSQAC